MMWLFFSLIWASPSALASGFAVQQQGAEVGTQGHTGATLKDSAEAAWFNPALLADGDGLRVSLGATFAAASIRATALDTSPDAPWVSETESGLSVPPPPVR